MIRPVQLAVATTLFGVGCVKISGPPGEPPDEVYISETELEWFDDPTVEVPHKGELVRGTHSVLLRTETDLALFHETFGLVPGNIFQFWYGAFQSPENCEQPNKCYRKDIANPRVNFTSIFGRIAQTVDDQGHIRATAKPAFKGDGTYSRFGQGIRDPITPQIMGFVRDHGPMLPELYTQQLGGEDGRFYDGGCKESGIKGADFDCYIPQIANHYSTLKVPGGATTHALIETRNERELPGSRAVVATNGKLVMGFVDTFGLPPKAAVSLWWAVFAAPENCAAGEGGCTIADLANPETLPQVVDSMLGSITPNNGTYLQTVAPFYFEELENKVPKYEVLLVLRNHGLYTDEQYLYERYSMNPGCELVTGGCTDAQYSRHEVSRRGG